MAGRNVTDCQVARLLAWLPKQSPEEWHAVALGWNWDVDLAPLSWIVSQEACDAGTAQFVFWQAMLAGFEANSAGPQPDLIRLIANRWERECYATWTFRVSHLVKMSESDLAAHATTRSFPAGLAVAGGDRTEPETSIVYDEGVPREIVLACFEECGEPLPAWLRPADPSKEALDALWDDIMKNEGIADEARRRAMWTDPLLLENLKRWRMCVDTEAFQRLSAESRGLIKRGKAIGDSAMEREGEAISTRAYTYLTRMQREFDVALYPEYPRPPKSGLVTRLFGRKKPD